MRPRRGIAPERRSDGTFRVRARVDGRLRTIATGVPTLAEAEELARASASVLDGRVRPVVALVDWGWAELDRREKRGVRSVSKERSVWRVHVAADPIAELAVGGVTRRDVTQWLARRTGAASTRKHALNLLRAVLQAACDHDIAESNPARDVRVPRSHEVTSRDELAGILLPDEQQRLLEVVPRDQRLTVLLALLTGLRQAELWWLRWEDIDLERRVITVRRSVRGRPPKSGRPRRVPMLPDVVTLLRSAPRTSQWVCPGRGGVRRTESKAPYGWRRWLRSAGIRHVRWHDLRHTCATSLLAGWWGRKWSLEEVRRYLGHGSVSVTERYARIVDEMTSDAADATVRSKFSVLSPAPGPSVFLAPPAGVEPATVGLGSRRESRVIPDTYASGRSLVRMMRLQILELIDPEGARRGLAVVRGYRAALSGEDAAAPLLELEG